MRLWRRRKPAGAPARASRGSLVPFADGALDPAVLEAAIRIARAEEAMLVPAYLVVVPLEFDVEAAAAARQAEARCRCSRRSRTPRARAGVPVDARIERGRTPIDALGRLWEVETFDRILVPALAPGHPGFSGKDLAWMLAHAPSETLVLRPSPDQASA